MTSSSLQVRVTIGSRFEDIDLVDVVSEALFRHAKFVGDDADRVSLAVRESVANAIQHGNKLDPDKRARVSFELQGGDLTIDVMDEGEGFDPNAVPDPLAPENLMKPTGRGILLMRQFVDSVEFECNEQGGGTKVTMRKRLSKAAVTDPGDAGTGGEPGIEEEGR